MQCSKRSKKGAGGTAALQGVGGKGGSSEKTLSDLLFLRNAGREREICALKKIAGEEGE